MPVTYSPLRYPGGKTQLALFVEDLIKQNELENGTYVEPFAGGAGIAWHLLRHHVVERVVINDISKSIYSFWEAVLNDTESLCQLIEETPVTIEEWYRQKEIQKLQIVGLELAFSTLFLNRVNRSGIINAGVIGGKAQAGKYKLDCRFKKQVLIDKISIIAQFSENITLTRMDAGVFLETIVSDLDDRTLVNIDPPYYNKGKELYQNFYEPDDHEELAKIIMKIQQPWMLTYDNTPEIFHLYRHRNPLSFCLNYSAQLKRKGSELVIFSPLLDYSDSFRQFVA
jgi:DNA adenine methylase